MKTCLIALFLLLAVGCKPADVARKSFQETKIEAEKGNAPAQYNLGVMYGNGRGVPKDEAEAYKWWLLAGAAGRSRRQDEHFGDRAQDHAGTKDRRPAAGS